jgi:hypothetical protein
MSLSPVRPSFRPDLNPSRSPSRSRSPSPFSVASSSSRSRSRSPIRKKQRKRAAKAKTKRKKARRSSPSPSSRPTESPYPLSDNSYWDSSHSFSNRGIEANETDISEAGQVDNVVVWEPAPCEDFVWVDSPDEEKSEDPDWCWYCIYSQSAVEKQKNDLLTQMDAIWDENTSCGLQKRCSLVREHFNENIRVYSAHKKPWLDRSIYAHYTEHRQHRPTQLELHARTFNHLFQTLRTSVLFERNANNPTQKRVNKDGANLYLRLFKEHKPLLAQMAENRPESSL